MPARFKVKFKIHYIISYYAFWILLKPTYCQYKLYGYNNYIKTEINYEKSISKMTYQKLISYENVDEDV